KGFAGGGCGGGCAVSSLGAGGGRGSCTTRMRRSSFFGSGGGAGALSRRGHGSAAISAAPASASACRETALASRGGSTSSMAARLCIRAHPHHQLGGARRSHLRETGFFGSAEVHDHDLASSRLPAHRLARQRPRRSRVAFHVETVGAG